jgi:hypothetical protein
VRALLKGFRPGPHGRLLLLTLSATNLALLALWLLVTDRGARCRSPPSAPPAC